MLVYGMVGQLKAKMGDRRGMGVLVCCSTYTFPPGVWRNHSSLFYLSFLLSNGIFVTGHILPLLSFYDFLKIHKILKFQISHTHTFRMTLFRDKFQFIFCKRNGEKLQKQHPQDNFKIGLSVVYG